MQAKDLAARLKLGRPLVWLDLESTVVENGADPDPKSDRIVHLAVVKIYPDGKVTRFSSLVNPGIPIAASSTEVHGITDSDVATAPPFRVIGRPVAVGLDDSDLAGYNARRYDQRLMIAECERHGIAIWERTPKVVDPFLLWAKMEPRDLDAFYERTMGRKRGGTHRADVDVEDALDAFMAALDLWPDLPVGVDALADLCWAPNPLHIDPDGKIQWRGDVPTMCFSAKYLGWDMRQVPKDFWKWVIEKSDCGRAVKQLAGDALRGVFPVRGQQRLALDHPEEQPELNLGGLDY